ncbi:MAG TPA: PQQ-binding-like beta-propeller repeat protein [Rhodanobacteraceae bacterium]|nr:PQQ-binding-like beta-propeller repeat protein [Rhodanobacteraceae bacterium]
MNAKARFVSTLVAMGALAAALPAWSAAPADWTTFGWDPGRSSAPDVATGIAASDLGTLQRQQVHIDGTVDSSAIYLHDVTVKGATHDVFFVTTTYGKTIAIDADHGTVLWEFTPASYDSLKGTAQITTATPVADPNRKYIYAASPEGVIRKLAVADGRVAWSQSITKLPAREKIASSLNFFNGRVIATTGGYIGDAPPYQGHVVLLDAKNGNLLHVWNALCSSRHALIDPASCPQSDAAIWGRAGAVVDTATGDLYVATGNAMWNGTEYWGDAVIELDPEATQILGNYTPVNTGQLNSEDLDVGSTSPVLTGGPYIVQGGKDGWLRVLDWRMMTGATPHRGETTSRVPTPGSGGLFSAPAVGQSSGATWLYVANGSGTAASKLVGDTLIQQWHNGNGGTSPVLAGKLLYVYDPQGALYVYDATHGRQFARLECGNGHWNSPIVIDGRIALPEGNANEHRTSGILNIWRLPEP